MFPVLAVCLIVSSNIASVMLSSLTVPRSLVVLIGDRVELKCSVTGSDLTKWTYTAWNASKETDIYTGIAIVVSMRSRYKVDKNINKKYYNLITETVDFTYTGRYQCTAPTEEKLWTDIQLTVLDSDPVCAANTTEARVDGKKQTHLTIWCSISYTGNGFPVFSWTKGNAAKTIAANTTTSGRGPFTKTSLIMQQLNAYYSGVTLQCRITFQMSNNSKEVVHNVYEYTWNYTLLDPAKESDGTPGASDFITALAIGGSLLFLLIIAIIVSCVVHRRRQRDDHSVRSDVALNTDHTLSDDIVLSSVRSTNYILKGDRSPERSDSRTNADNPVYTEVRKPNGPSTGSKGGNISDDSRPLQTPNRERKIVIGADGSECAEQSGRKRPARKGEVPKPPAFSQVELYASIDRNRKVPAPPLLPKL